MLRLIVPAILASLLLGTLNVGAAFADGGCTDAIARTTGCPTPTIGAENNGDGVTIIGKVDVRGPGAPGAGGPAVGIPIVAPTPPPPPAVVRDGYTAYLIRISDLVNFKPTPGTNHMQPDGWMVVGLDANFYSRAATQVKTGDLLGKPATVRFTPAAYRWSYGDGSSRVTTTPGATWHALGLDEFDRTATSHAYRAAGTYVIDLSIGFVPEYRYASDTDWIPIAGYVWSSANRLVAIAGDSKTVLVERDCLIAPSGPGC